MKVTPMRLLLAAALLAAAGTAEAQPAKIAVAIDARSESGAAEAATGLLADVRRGLEALGDVAIVPAAQARRMIWIIAGGRPGLYAASLMVTERYDRETLMVLGIEDDDMAERMMALQIANDHQMVTAADAADLSRRVVESINTGVLARLRARPPKP
jgi:hypothetical protein